MAHAEQKTETVVTGVTLDLDPEEAGYLIDLLSAHVGGSLTTNAQPLGRIRAALVAAGVTRHNAWNSRGRQTYASLFATRQEASDSFNATNPWRSEES